MPWYMPWSDSIKKRACRYLLQRYLGQFLEEKLTLDQLTVDLYNGTGTVREVSLDVQALNELGEQQNIPVEFVDGYISEISVSIPWLSVLTDASYVEVTGLILTVQPKKRADCGASMFESMWNSMSTSMQLAQECLKQDNEDGKDNDQAQPLDGLERFAQTIDSILCRVKVKFVDTVIRMEHVPKESNSGVALELRIKNMDYFDEAGSEPHSSPPPDAPSQQKVFEVAAFTSKKFCMEGVLLFTDEFPFQARTFSRSLMSTSGSGSTPDSKNSEDTSPVTPASPSDEPTGMTSPPNVSMTPDPIVFAKLHGRQEVRVKMKQNESIPGPKVDLEVNFGAVSIFLSPRQVHALIELMKGLSSPDSVDNSNVCPRSRCAEKPMEASDFQRVERDLQQQLRLLPSTQGTGLQFSKGWSTAPLEDSDDEFLPMQGRNELSESIISNAASMETSVSSNMSGSSYMSRPHYPSGYSGITSPDGSGMDSRSTFNKSSRRRSNTAGIDESWGETTRFQLRASSMAAVLLHEDILTVTVLDSDGLGKRTPGISCVQGGLATSSLLQMKEAAQRYFRVITEFAQSGKMESDLLTDNEIFLEACPLSHLRLVVCPLVIEGKERTTPLVSVVQVSVTAANLSCIECLVERTSSSTLPSVEYVELLRFVQGNGTPSHMTAGMLPNLRALYKCSERAAGQGHPRRYSHPCGSLTINLQPCISELDISIADRITAILNPQPLCQKTANRFGISVGQTFMNRQSCFYQAVETPCTQDYKQEIKVSCPFFTIKTRFPIPDLRPIHDMDRPPWWKRCVHKDIMTLELTNASLRTVMDSRESCSRYELQCSDIQEAQFSGSIKEFLSAVTQASPKEVILSKETDMDIPVPFIRASAQNKNESELHEAGEGFGWPRLVFTVHPLSGRRELEEPLGSIGMQESSIESTLEGSTRREPSPFSSKKVIHESDTPHAKHRPPTNVPPVGETFPISPPNFNASQDESEELIIPGDKQEMADFIDQASVNSRFKLDITLPCATMQLSSKHFYEVLYNRINTDLLLWEPSAPKPASGISPPTASADFHSAHPAFLQDDGYTFGACKSGIKYDSDSDSDNDAVYHSVYEHSQRQKRKLLLESRSSFFGQSNFTLSLNVGHGIIGLQTPVRDTIGNVIPNQHGELDIVMEDGNLFAVSSYKGNPELGFVCIQVSKASLNHIGMVPTTGDPVTLPPIGSPRSSNLRPTIYESGPGASTGKNQVTQWVRQMQQRSGGWTGGHSSRADMLSVAIRIHADPSTSLKNFRVAAGIRGATLRHYVTPSMSSWLTQLVDFFDVLDYPVPGYSPPRVITELHLHLWDCAVDYRPLHLPLLSVITLGSFSVSSNMAAQTNTSTLRFIAEDAALFISDKVPSKPPSVRRVRLQGDSPESVGSSHSVDLRRDYVCVLEMGLFELSLRLYEGPHSSTPKVDLRASNNIVHLRTCADSGRALTELLTYFASDGDLVGVEGSLGETAPSVSPLPSTENLSTDSGSPAMSRFRAEHVHDLMEEAMRDAGIPHADGQPASAISDPAKKGVEVFFFPDEGIIPTLKGESGQKNADANQRVPIFTGGSDLGSLDGDYEGMDVTVPQCMDDEDDEEFCILEDDPGTGIPSRTGEPEVRILGHEPIRIVDNHFYIPAGKADLLRAPSHYPSPILRYALREMTLVWHLYGGHDFGAPEEDVSPKPRRTSGRSHGTEERTLSNERTPAGSKVQYNRTGCDPSYGLGGGGVVYYKSGPQEMQLDGTMGSPRSGSHVILPSSPLSKFKQQQPLTWQAKGGPGRRHDILMELQLNKVRFQHEVYPEDTKEASRQVVLIHDVEVRDRLATSQINKFLYQYSSEAKPRQSHANMVVIKAVHIRPDPNLGVQECCLKISILPLRLNIDQDSLLFLYNFFNQLSGGSVKEEDDRASPGLQGPPTPRHTPTHQVPVMVVNISGASSGGSSSGTPHQSPPSSVDSQSETQIDQSRPLILLEEEGADTVSNALEWESPKKAPIVKPKSKDGSLDLVSPIQDDNDFTSSPSPPIFFRSLIFSPDVPIRLDYHGKRVDMTHGPLAGLLMGLGQLNCSEIRLKRLSYRHGLLGFDKLLGYMLTEWLQDIKRNQLPSLLGGVGPMHSLVQLFQGIRDLFWLPIEQYQKDGRIVRGLQRGANSFTTSTAMAALELTSRLVNAIQSTAETAYDMVSPGPSVRRRLPGRKDCQRRYHQPADIREGMANAYHLVKEGLGDTAQTIVRVASEEHEHKGVSGAVGGVLRQIPPTVVRPLVLASQATSNVLGGMRSQLVPDARREAVQKWRPEDEDL